MCVRDRAFLIIIPSPVHVGQLLEAGSPVIEVVIVLVPRAGGVKRADRAGSGAAALIVKNQQGVVRRSCGVVVCSSQTLKRKRWRTEKGRQSLNFHISSTPVLSTSTFSFPGLKGFEVISGSHKPTDKTDP